MSGGAAEAEAGAPYGAGAAVWMVLSKNKSEDLLHFQSTQLVIVCTAGCERTHIYI